MTQDEYIFFKQACQDHAQHHMPCQTADEVMRFYDSLTYLITQHKAPFHPQLINNRTYMMQNTSADYPSFLVF